MRISYAITYKDEMGEVHSLLSKLNRWLKGVNYGYEIVILQDNVSTRPLLPSDEYRLVWREFDNDYSAHKNYLNSQCKGDFIFQLDADEYPSSVLVDYAGTLLEQNPDVDLWWVPRVNTVEGLTVDHVRKWGWRTEALEGVELLAVNWPDYQGRIYRNNPNIRWVNKVHEHIEGAMKYAKLPMETVWALFHPKTIEKQEAQNAKYMTMQR
jgi:hypothetical protein